jgi:hypothetical protein
MAKKWSNLNLPGALHYLTGNVLNRIPIFKDDSSCLGFLEQCRKGLVQCPCKLITLSRELNEVGVGRGQALLPYL